MAAPPTLTDNPGAAPDIPPGMYRVPQAAKLLGVGERFLRDGFNHRGFPGARIDGKLIFSGEDLRHIYQMFRLPPRKPSPPKRRRRATTAAAPERAAA